MGSKPTLRDFVYLDWERVRSLAAQLFSGIPETKTSGQSREAEAKGQLEGNAMWLLKAQVGADYRYFRTENETRSFHHYIYSLVEDKLVDDESVLNIDENFDPMDWSERFFKDGQFVRVKGVVRFMDYEWFSMMLEAMPQLYRAVTHLENYSLKQSPGDSATKQQEIANKRKEHQRRSNEMKELKLGEITGLIRQLYGDTIRVKVVPNKKHSNRVFVGTAEVDSFHDTAASLTQKYGHEIDADWIVLGQINISNVSADPLPIPIGNDMEDFFEEVALAVSQLNRTATAVKFPAVSFTPISVYREC